MLVTHSPVLAIVVPLLCAFATSIAGVYNRKFCYYIATFGLAISFIGTNINLFRVVTDGTIQYNLGGWAPPIGIVFVIDKLNALILEVVSFVALISLIASKKPIERTARVDQYPHFYTLFLLLVAGLMGISTTGDAFNLYVLLEITSLTTYALVAMNGGRAYIATFNYIIMGTIGASFYLLGVGYLYIKTGSLNMADLHSLLPAIYNSQTIHVAFILILIGIMVKMAFFPLHGWLPNAYTYANNSVSTLLAPLATKVSVYVLIRVMFWVFSATYVYSILRFQNTLIWLSILAIFAGAFMALSQKDIKKRLTYIVVSEIGYMMGGIWLGNELALTGAIFHVLSDALVTLCLFLVISMITYKRGNYERESFSGLFQKMPFTMAIFVLAVLAVIGVPPTSGFFSKVYLVSGAITAHHWPFAASLILASLINVTLLFRIIELAYFPAKNISPKIEKELRTISEAPLTMLIPAYVVGIAILALGIFSGTIIENFILPTVRGVF